VLFAHYGYDCLEIGKNHEMIKEITFCADLENREICGKWDDFVVNHPGGTPSHLSGWLKTTTETYGFKPRFFSMNDESGCISGVFPLFIINSPLRRRRIISLPFSDFGGPLVRTGGDGSVFGNTLDEVGGKKTCIEIRGNLSHPDFVRNKHYKRHTINLDRDIEVIWKSINKRTIHRSVRKAEDAGITVRFTDDYNGILEFIWLNRLTRKKHGVPAQPKKWFELLQKLVLAQGRGFIAIAEKDNRPVGASVFLTIANQLHYKYNASDPEIVRKVSPNHLITWKTIKWGVEKGYSLFDFGRTSPDNEGLIRYKEMWGSVATDLPYYYFPKVHGVSSLREKGLKYRIFSKLWQSLPEVVSEPLSTVLYKYLT
jgi:hypothetical protein